MIEVTRTGDDEPLTFEVIVLEGAGETRNAVTMPRPVHERLSNGACPPEKCIEAAFRFLLDREQKEAILERFDVTGIARYFPCFEIALPDYLGRQ